MRSPCPARSPGYADPDGRVAPPRVSNDALRSGPLTLPKFKHRRHHPQVGTRFTDQQNAPERAGYVENSHLIAADQQLSAPAAIGS